MKKTVPLFLILVAISFQCTDVVDQPTRSSLSPELTAELNHLSRILSAVWENQLRLMPRKILTSSASITNILEATRAGLDKQRQALFDASLNHPEMQKFVNWGKAMLDSNNPSFSGGRVRDVWDFNSVTSTESKNMLGQLRNDVEYTMSSMEGASQQSITAAVTNTVYYFELSVYASTTLSQADKDALGAAANELYASISLIVQNALYEYVPENQNKTQWNWRKCWKVVGSIVLVTAACAFVAGVIGGIIVATGGAAALGLPTTVTMLGGWVVGFAAVSTMIGGAVGLAAGTGMAASDICAYSGPGWNFGTESCSI